MVTDNFGQWVKKVQESEEMTRRQPEVLIGAQDTLHVMGVIVMMLVHRLGMAIWHHGEPTSMHVRANEANNSSNKV